MDVAPARDWVIIILGILEIILVIGLIIVLIVLYNKINKLVSKGKEVIAKGRETVMRVEHAVASPYLTVGSWVFRIIASGLGMLQKRSAKGE